MPNQNLNNFCTIYLDLGKVYVYNSSILSNSGFYLLFGEISCVKIKLIQTGKSHFGFVNQGFEEYQRRLKHYVDFSYQEVQLPGKDKSQQPELIKKAEALLQLKLIKPTDYLVLLDERGKQPNSPGLAEIVQKWMLHHANVIILIGGAYGFDTSIYERANAQLSLSNLTFSHQLIKLILSEQLYRAFTIIRGEPYHHGS